MNQPSRWLLIVSGVLTQVVGAACLILNLASLPFAHDLHARTHSIIASIVAALATIVCGTLVWRGRLIPIALAAGLEIGFGIGLQRGSAATGTLLKVLSPGDVATANGMITGAAIAMFVAAIVCVLAIPAALRLRAWARSEQEREALAARGAEGERAKRASTGAIIPPAASTLRGVGPKLMPTQVIRIGTPNKWRPLIIVGVAITMIAIGIVVITATTGTSKKATDGIQLAQQNNKAGSASGSATTEPRAGSGSGSGSGSAETPVEEVIARLGLALEHAKADELGLLFDSKAFGIGVEANELAEGRDAIVAMLRHDLGEPPAKGFDISVRFSKYGHEGDTGWIAEELKVGSKVFVMSAVVALTDGAWTIEAVHWAQTMPNEEAFRRARDNTLPIADAIPNSHGDDKLSEAMRQGFASKPSFITARSTREDGLNFGSAPGERIIGGDNVKKIFSRIKATIRLNG
ncbi:MAG TPA: nuclear transport factor 2 family protein, partial [Kofleriaceae bacterium]